MKKYVLFLFFVALTGIATAQNFTLEPSQIDTEEPLNAQNDNAGYAIVTNTSSSSTTYVWERNVLTIPDEWQSAVCDKVRCYLPFVDSQEFTMNPAEEGDMIVHVYPNQVEGEARIEVKVYEKDNPDNTITGVYNFFIGVTGVLEVTKSLTKLFPNPTTGEINLQLWLDQPAQTQVEIQNAQGQRVALNNYGRLQGENLLDIENPGMAPGMYFVVIHLDDQLFTKKLLVK